MSPYVCTRPLCFYYCLGIEVKEAHTTIEVDEAHTTKEVKEAHTSIEVNEFRIGLFYFYS